LDDNLSLNRPEQRPLQIEMQLPRLIVDLTN